jgi:hypothetical protein
MSERYVALLRDPAPLGGICPACDQVMDESGCRVGEHVVSRDLSLTRGIAQVIEVFCAGAPAAPVVGCPSCAETG